MSPRSPRSSRGTAFVLAAAIAVVLAGGGPASASPSDQPGGTSGVLDSRALDDLRKRAARLGRTRPRARGALALGVRRHLSRA